MQFEKDQSCPPEGALSEELLVRQSPEPANPVTTSIVQFLQHLTHAAGTPPRHSLRVEPVDDFARQARRGCSSKHAPRLLELPAVPGGDVGKEILDRPLADDDVIAQGPV
ncbi:MAG TPA: hypothetical protein VLW53_04460, partial [Candidatus Eisenbacteria bacterium]|nr:hypothetical protein [Candidatus Eisenbacteria bacterium]